MQAESDLVSRLVLSVSSSQTGKILARALLGFSIATATVTVTTDANAAGTKYAGIVIDANTGNVLYSENADTLHYPASLTKMMTVYLTFEALEAGRITLDTPVVFSRNAAAQAPTKLGIGAGHSVTVREAILGIVTKSANDAAMGLGEMLGGSEEGFARLMNDKARALGMTRTTYRNPNGLPNTAQMTTARDQARLGVALREHFPQYYGFFSETSFRLGSRVIPGHNRLIGSVRGVDGIKTGYTRAAGYNLATSVKIDGRSIVGVVLGGASTPARDNQMRKLIAEYLPVASTKHIASNVIAQAPAATPNLQAASARMADMGRAKIKDDETAEATDTHPSSAAAFAAVAPQSSNPLLSAKPVQRPSSEEVASVATSDDGDEDEVDTVTTASTKADTKLVKLQQADKSEKVAKAAKAEREPAGWVVQIGVSPSKNGASDLLDTAKSKGGKALRSAKPYAVAFDGGYRARFGGFEDQGAALNACKALKRAGVKCWASME
ncbi:MULTISPECIES: D-alanyl-D-alanine carboxypeptidase [unclassified Rhizobium]|uniref:D-alanyl-D-alanine carboxypeptidase n=1 Tax=unclassified Rhizobium TaxID=2613769 RepID=UPI000EAA0CE0|nr:MULTISPECIES: D-alanyl-D-alanine carboxypeptidase [unclassified Rhizobium]AYG66331.1 D-alanyl-D-alanine carboxypeptidase [Rhizobium sp. CCGE531]AYG72712.1 D-alanyl-D-alanine carboxypeptidase [Rhizobium sp. CCGE532]